MMKIRGLGSPMKADPCGDCKEIRMKRMGGARGGDTIPPRHHRRTPPHQKGVAFPGNWAVNNPPKAKRASA